MPIEALPSSQAIVVLSVMLMVPPGDAPLGEWSDAVDRFEAGVALFHAGKAPVLVFTGAWVPWSPAVRPEGEILAERQEQRSTTADTQIILVTSAFHMRRARVLFARAGFQGLPFSVDFQVSVRRAFTMLDLLPTADSLSKTETALREWYGRLFYQLVGRCIGMLPSARRS